MILDEQDKAVKEKQAEHLKIIFESARYQERLTKVLAFTIGTILFLIWIAYYFFY